VLCLQSPVPVHVAERPHLCDGWGAGSQRAGTDHTGTAGQGRQGGEIVHRLCRIEALFDTNYASVAQKKIILIPQKVWLHLEVN